MKIIQTGLILEKDFDVFATQMSGNVEIELVRDSEYEKAVIVPYISYTDEHKELIKKPLTLNDNKFKLPFDAFRVTGNISLSLEIQNKNESTLVTQSINFRVNKSSVDHDGILPEDKDSWITIVTNVVEQYIDTEIRDDVNSLIETSKQHEETVTELIGISKEHQETVNAMVTLVNEVNDIAIESKEISETALKNSNEALDKSTVALSNSKTALDNSNEALETANQAMEIADQTLDEDEHAKIVGIDNRVVAIDEKIILIDEKITEISDATKYIYKGINLSTILNNSMFILDENEYEYELGNLDDYLEVNGTLSLSTLQDESESDQSVSTLKKLENMEDGV